MSRIETSNTWEEGLVMDLNPLSTPNNVLTDCVNGTFITYNGNEFSLQNDQGNYKLEYCRLTPNYIPVGVKEYGDILYVVSHNPLDGSVEIGSYPSPLMITVPNEKHNNNDFDSIIDSQILDKGLSEGNYTELMENASNIIFNGEDYKLNPGDEYCLQTEGARPPYKYETIEYHILDEDSNVHVITDKIKLDENGNPKDFSHVAWTVPGWLSIKARLAELSIAGINIRSFYVPKNNAPTKTAHFAFNLRLNVNDSYLMRKLGDNPSILQDWCSKIDAKQLQDVRFRVFIEKENNGQFESIYGSEFIEFGITDITSPAETKKRSTSASNFFLNEFDWTEWYGDSRVLWKNVSGKIEGLEADSKVRVRMIPVLFEEEYNYKIVYDNLEQSLLFDLAAVEDDEWDLGNELYQFYLSSDKQTQYIYTNISGPMISTFPVNLYGDVYDINGKIVISDHVFEDYSGIGENVLQLPFKGNFESENIYVIQFKFAPSINEIGNFPTVARFLITSEVFNDFTDIMVYDRDIKFDEWIKRYWFHNKTEFKLNYKDIDIDNIVGYVNDTIFENADNVQTEADKKYFSGNKYNTFFPDQQSGLSDAVIYRKGYQYNLEYNTEINEVSLTGDLWDDFQPNNKLMMMDYSNNTKVPFNQYPLLNPENPSYRTENISAYIELFCKYQKMGIPFDFVNTDFWYFIDDLEKLKAEGKSIPKLTGKLTDYVYELSIEITGNHDNDEYNNDRSVSVKGDLYKNGIVYNSKYNFTQYVDGKNEKHSYLPYSSILSAINDNNIPFLFVKVNYSLNGRSDNYELIQTISGGPNDGDITGDFTFRKTTDTSFSLYYVAFVAESKDIPILIPLSSNTGFEYFKNMCKKLSIALNEGIPTATDRYVLNLESTIQYDPRLTIYNVGQFNDLSKLQYMGFDLKERISRINLITYLKSTLNLENDIKYCNIIIDTKDDIEKAMRDESFIVFDKTLATVSFNQEGYPYVAKDNLLGINDVRMNLIKLSSNSEKDFERWNNSTQLNEGGIIKGLYCDDMFKSESNVLLDMNAGFLNGSDCIIYMTPKTFVETEGITEKTLKSKWKESSEGSILANKFKHKAQWFCWHNWWNAGAESDNYILLGGCYARKPDIRLDYEWKNWVKSEI